MTELLTIVLGLFAIVNPFGAIPVFVSLTQNGTYSWRKNQAFWGSMSMGIILIVFFLLGNYILNFFGISISGIRVAGGLIVLKAGYDLYNRVVDNNLESETIEGDIAFSPLAMPILSGPGSIAFVIGLSAKNGSYIYLNSLLSIACITLITFIILLLSPKLMKVLGKKGMEKLSKISGFITMAIGTQMVLTGLKSFFQVGF